MAQAPALILRTLDKHMTGSATLRVMGGASMTLAYGLDRATEDVDLLLNDAEAQFLAENCNFGEALEKTNAELESLGLYISHIWGPEQQILTPQWRTQCRIVSDDLGLKSIRLETLGPLDIIVSKMARADDGDLADMRHLISREQLNQASIEAAVSQALVPEILKEQFELSRPRVLGLASASGV
jgi:hypothetical protein